MKSLAERLIGEMELSDLYKRKNFGAVVGADFPELARELIANKEVATKFTAQWLGEMIRRLKGADLIQGSEAGPWLVAQNHPELAETPLMYLYWGMRIGRELEREQATVLNALEQEQA